jgi:hypothetical protein
MTLSQPRSRRLINHLDLRRRELFARIVSGGCRLSGRKPDVVRTRHEGRLLTHSRHGEPQDFVGLLAEL